MVWVLVLHTHNVTLRIINVLSYKQLHIVTTGHRAIRRAHGVGVGWWARLNPHRRRQWHRLVANHLARAQVFEACINRVARRARAALHVNSVRLARVANRILAARLVVLARAVGRWARLSAQVVLQVHNVAFDLGHGGAADDAELHTALAAILVLDGVERVRQGTRALVELFLVGARVVDEAVGTHCGKKEVERRMKKV